MLAHSASIKIWLNSATRRLLEGFSFLFKKAAADSRLVNWTLGEGCGGIPLGFIPKTLTKGAGFMIGLVDGGGKILKPVVKNSGLLNLFSPADKRGGGFCLAFALAFGVMLLVGGVVLGKYWALVGALLLLAVGLLLYVRPLWPLYWSYSVLGRLWLALLAAED